MPIPAGFGNRRPRVIDPPARDHYDENNWSDDDLWYAYDVRYHFIARSQRGMALYASVDPKAVTLRLALTLSTARTRRSSISTSCGGTAATDLAGRRAQVDEQA